MERWDGNFVEKRSFKLPSIRVCCTTFVGIVRNCCLLLLQRERVLDGGGGVCVCK
jgi:hypothetical protein